MVTKDIVLGPKISKAGLEVNQAKIDTITKLSAPTNVKTQEVSLAKLHFTDASYEDYCKL